MNSLLSTGLHALIFCILIYPGSQQLHAQSLPYNMHFNEDSSRLISGGVQSTGFYDEGVIREVYLDFSDPDYWDQMLENYDTENYVLASLSYDGLSFDSVAVQFKGQTSFRQAVKRGSEKLSFSVKLNEVIDGQDIDGYNNFNFNNAAGDFSFMKEVLYARLSRDFLPALKGNFIKLYLNGNYWGLYANIQQLNGDFIEEWFPEEDGIRWRADNDTLTQDPSDPPPPGAMTQLATNEGQWGNGTAALNYLGDTLALYQQYYTLKDSDLDDPWSYLVRVCDVLNNTDPEHVYDSLKQVMDVDATLWFLAQEIVFSDDDSYVHKGRMDYYLYWEEASGRMLPLEFDGNTAMALRNKSWSPFMNQDDPNYPLLNILLSIPELRQRYVAHVRTILDGAFTSGKAHSLINAYKQQITPVLQTDPKIDYPIRRHNIDTDSLRAFVNFRPGFIKSYPDFTHEVPVIAEIKQFTQGIENRIPEAGEAVLITARATHSEGISRLRLYYGSGLKGRFEVADMNDSGEAGDEAAGDGIFSASIPGEKAGNYVRYYIEAIAGNSAGTACFLPEGASYDVFVYHVRDKYASEKTVVINEFMASNSSSVADEAGEYDDWVELYNTSDAPVSMAGFHLSDNFGSPYKWAFPDVEIPENGYLTLWADKDTLQGELHMNFKLSAGGEELILSDADSAIMDILEFSNQATDLSTGRWPNGSGEFMVMNHTRGAENTSGITGIKDDVSGSTLKVWPNPSSGTLNLEISVEPAEPIRIFSIRGKLVFKGPFREQIDLSPLPPGMYIISCGSDRVRFLKY